MYTISEWLKGSAEETEQNIFMLLYLWDTRCDFIVVLVEPLFTAQTTTRCIIEAGWEVEKIG